MASALVEFAIDLDGDGTWATTDRVIERVILDEGRAPSGLGGPDPPARTSALQTLLDNHDGYFTKGAGAGLGPGSRIRVRWRASTSDPWVVRYVGLLAERTVEFNLSSRVRVRWLGNLWKFTSGNVHGRLLLGQTPQAGMNMLAEAAGIPASERDFDTSATTYNRNLSAGYAGVQEWADTVGGFVYDGETQLRLELAATRRARSVAATYSDDPVAGELGVPPPQDLLKPFGIINHVDGELQIYAPSSPAASADVALPDWDSGPAFRFEDDAEFSVSEPLDFIPVSTATVTDYSFTVTNPDTGNTFDISHPTTETPFLSPMFLLDNIAFAVVGDTVTFSWQARWIGPGTAVITHVRITDVMATIEPGEPGDGGLQTFRKPYVRQMSVDRFGFRRRSGPVVITTVRDTPIPADFMPDFGPMDALVAAELDRFAEPHEVFAVQRASAQSDGHRDDILVRRISDRVRLRLSGPSQLDTDIQAFAEAMQTLIDPNGQVIQTLYLAEADDRFVLGQTMGLALTAQDDGFEADWDAVADADAYELEYRASGAAMWVSVDATGTSHTVTGLMDATEYEARVRATATDYGEPGPYSEIETVTTT